MRPLGSNGLNTIGGHGAKSLVGLRFLHHRISGHDKATVEEPPTRPLASLPRALLLPKTVVQETRGVVGQHGADAPNNMHGLNRMARVACVRLVLAYVAPSLQGRDS